MAQRIFAVIILLLGVLLSIPGQASFFADKTTMQFVPADRAFVFDFQQTGRQLQLSWQIKSGYYLYRKQIHLEAQHARIAPLALPSGNMHEDEFFGKTEIYQNALHLPVTILQADKNATLQLSWQGCAASGFCYPPQTREIPLTAVTGENTPTNAIAGHIAPTAVSSTTSGNTLPFSPLWALLIGIGIAFTPCVLPMYPLISGIILGRQRQLSTMRLLALALVYVQGMALTYTLLGVAVAAAGLPFQAALQQPWVLISLSILFVVLALSMFGLFTLQLPSSLQTRLTLWSNRQQGGSLPGVLLMGMLAGLICSPCTTAPLSAILLYIAQSGNIAAGAGTLWLYSTGMGLPLIIVTLFGHRFLPKSGPWMNTVKEGFGFVILALPVFLLQRITGELWGTRLWSLLAVSFFCWAFLHSLHMEKKGRRILQIGLLAAAVISVRPLQDWAFNSPVQQSQTARLSFTPISTATGLQQSLRQAAGKVTMVDLYADWCVACKEFEKYTFSDPDVQRTLNTMQRLQANVTANSQQNTQLLRYLKVSGLPTILFFDARGEEIPGSRVAGFMKAKAFLNHLQKFAIAPSESQRVPLTGDNTQ